MLVALVCGGLLGAFVGPPLFLQEVCKVGVGVVDAMAVVGAVVREVVTSAVLANAHSGAASSSPSFAKAGASIVGRNGWMRDGNPLRRRAQFSNRTETKGLVSATIP